MSQLLPMNPPPRIQLQTTVTPDGVVIDGPATGSKNLRIVISDVDIFALAEGVRQAKIARAVEAVGTRLEKIIDEQFIRFKGEVH